MLMQERICKISGLPMSMDCKMEVDTRVLLMLLQAFVLHSQTKTCPYLPIMLICFFLNNKNNTYRVDDT